MYLTDIRGFSAEDYYILNKDFDTALALGGSPIFSAKADALCKITIHGMGIRGDKGLSLHFAKFCVDYLVNPSFISICDMGISFFILPHEKSRVLDALCEYFPIWV